jgi:hypothetical protein
MLVYSMDFGSPGKMLAMMVTWASGTASWMRIAVVSPMTPAPKTWIDGQRSLETEGKDMLVAVALGVMCTASATASAIIIQRYRKIK